MVLNTTLSHNHDDDFTPTLLPIDFIVFLIICFIGGAVLFLCAWAFVCCTSRHSVLKETLASWTLSFVFIALLSLLADIAIQSFRAQSVIFNPTRVAGWLIIHALFLAATAIIVLIWNLTYRLYKQKRNEHESVSIEIADSATDIPLKCERYSCIDCIV
eukprot:13883683-Ditylum_brightwellii.AAC.1